MPKVPPTTALTNAVSVESQAPDTKARWVCEQLDDEYGVLVWRSHGEPLGALVMTMLSQHTSDKNSERAYDHLRRRYPTWEAVRTAPVEEIADTIRSGGLADAKAPRIRRVLEEIHERYGETTLDFLYRTPTEEAKTLLHGFHGVGPKTAACVLMFSLERPVLPVDTHVFRVSHRLGLIPQGIGEAKAHDALQALLPPERVYAFHVHMIRHGRRVCQSQRPRCGACVLQENCDFYRSGDKTPTMAISAVKESQRDTLHGMPGAIATKSSAKKKGGDNSVVAAV